MADGRWINNMRKCLVELFRICADAKMREDAKVNKIRCEEIQYMDLTIYYSVWT